MRCPLPRAADAAFGGEVPLAHAAHAGTAGATDRLTVCPSGNSLPYRLEHLLREQIDLVERRIDVRRDPDSLELGVYDRGGDDPVLVHQPGTELRRVDAIHHEEPDR